MYRNYREEASGTMEQNPAPKVEIFTSRAEAGHPGYMTQIKLRLGSAKHPPVSTNVDVKRRMKYHPLSAS